LVGVPGAGKSTWISKQEWVKDCAYIGTDKHVNTHAKLVGKTYSEVFVDFMPSAIRIMIAEVEIAKSAGKDIIWDQTSTTAASRSRKFRMLPDYEHIAVVFATPALDELARRLANRYDSGKIIPEHVMRSMIDNWEEPTLEEGFEEIWRV